GDRAREADEAEVERRELRDAVLHRELHDEPAETEDLHPGADVRHDEAGPEEAEIAVAERRDERGATGFGGTGLVERAFHLQLGSEALFRHRSSVREVPAARVHGSRTHHGTQRAPSAVLKTEDITGCLALSRKSAEETRT